MVGLVIVVLSFAMMTAITVLNMQNLARSNRRLDRCLEASAQISIAYERERDAMRNQIDALNKHIAALDDLEAGRVRAYSTSPGAEVDRNELLEALKEWCIEEPSRDRT